MAGTDDRGVAHLVRTRGGGLRRAGDDCVSYQSLDALETDLRDRRPLAPVPRDLGHGDGRPRRPLLLAFLPAGLGPGRLGMRVFLLALVLAGCANVAALPSNASLDQVRTAVKADVGVDLDAAD